MVNGGMMSRRVRPPVPHSPGGHLSFEGSPEHDSLSKHAEAEEVTSRAQAQPGRSVKVRPPGAMKGGILANGRPTR